MAHDDLKQRIRAAFAADLARHPPMTLRSADSVETYGVGLPFDPVRDQSTPAYFDHYGSGVAHLDPASWRHYLPQLAIHALDFPEYGGLTIAQLLQSLRPPDRHPPRLRSLSKPQEDVMRQFLEVVASSPASNFQRAASEALEEWWTERASLRNAGLSADIAWR